MTSTTRFKIGDAKFIRAADVMRRDVVRTAEVSEVSDHDSVPPGETMVVTGKHASLTYPGYTELEQAAGDPLRCRDDQLLPAIRRVAVIAPFTPAGQIEP